MSGVSELFIGLMSGTSLDGVDGVLVDFSKAPLAVMAYAGAPFSDDLRQELLALNSPGTNELHRAALASNALVRVYAQVVARLLEQSKLGSNAVTAIGAHGQTVRHRPQAFDGTGYTLQLNSPALLAELTAIDIVADFRSRDVAAGGQGAPLVPAFHQSVFGRPGETIATLNVGGISNLTVLGSGSMNDVLGFDCGPGNALMDAWCQRHLKRSYDTNGDWAATGKIHEGLLQALLSEPYFNQPAPKSTGRDLFNPDWLADRLGPFAHLAPADVQATLTELTASACAQSIQRYALASKELIVCGGGAFNGYLMQRLQALLPSMQVCSSEAYGLPPLQVEAAAFAWLARQTTRRETSSLEKVTGARGARILGAIYPA
ncbi:anhydro-N-acetylmuramic acid kinase [Rhodoferax sp.]|uniref:anhydro-N-acetylmuramic acid kinase n=1 Tax=Rhodoferax sp. TaxID=50421 RepID=UPI001EB86C12|nr:anhydro-N-acetylmuramic acid kinase [Rhodoferax sp.]MBT9505860.1 anhydro-N-acetylmuramic acid kinase [Rhodoferax sp.]